MHETAHSMGVDYYAYQGGAFWKAILLPSFPINVVFGSTGIISNRQKCNIPRAPILSDQRVLQLCRNVYFLIFGRPALLKFPTMQITQDDNHTMKIFKIGSVYWCGLKRP